MASNSSVGGKLKTAAILTTNDGERINLGVLDRRVGIKLDVFDRIVSLTIPWTPRLWYYKFVTYPTRIRKQKKAGK